MCTSGLLDSSSPVRTWGQTNGEYICTVVKIMKHFNTFNDYSNTWQAICRLCPFHLNIFSMFNCVFVYVLMVNFLPWPLDFSEKLGAAKPSRLQKRRNFILESFSERPGASLQPCLTPRLWKEDSIFFVPTLIEHSPLVYIEFIKSYVFPPIPLSSNFRKRPLCQPESKAFDNPQNRPTSLHYFCGLNCQLVCLMWSYDV